MLGVLVAATAPREHPLAPERYVTPHDEAANAKSALGRTTHRLFNSLIAAWTVLSWALAPPLPAEQVHPSLNRGTVIPGTQKRRSIRKHAMPTHRERMP